MSYIDTFDHEFVGYFGGIPVYHPLEVVPARPDDHPKDFPCGPNNLVIGGGSGEHPGIIVKEPEQTVEWFVRTWLDETNFLSKVELPELQNNIETWPASSYFRKDPIDHQRLFEFAGWRVADYTKFVTRCESRAFHRPLDLDKDRSVEQWLAASIGEFILFAMPELAENAVERLGDLRQHITGDLYRNLLLLPPGYFSLGRQEVDNVVIWGISAWRITRKQNPQSRRTT